MIDDSDILELLGRGPTSSTAAGKVLGVSRQAVHARLKALMASGRVVREGMARATRYRLPAAERWERNFPLAGLAEDRVLQQMIAEDSSLGRLTGEAEGLVAYVVTELVNNAIDHSSGNEVRVSAEQRGTLLLLEIDDDGVGAFAHVRDSLGLPSELAAIQELSKGKITTAPEHHTGEGLFFTSKAVNFFRLASGAQEWIVDNRREDMAVVALESTILGTLVSVEIDLADIRSLALLFDEYAQDHEFGKTRTVVRLFAIGVRFVSRSEAKRLLNGLERFREVVVDFRGVAGIGQGFADEIFRVWARAHPAVSLEPVNMNEQVAFMVARARKRD